MHDAKANNECFFVYGPASVGKSSIFAKDPFATIIDCTEMVNSISSLEDVDLALEYLEKRFQDYHKRAIPKYSTLVFDNINGLCSLLSSD